MTLTQCFTGATNILDGTILHWDEAAPNLADG